MLNQTILALLVNILPKLFPNLKLWTKKSTCGDLKMSQKWEMSNHNWPLLIDQFSVKLAILERSPTKIRFRRQIREERQPSRSRSKSRLWVMILLMPSQNLDKEIDLCFQGHRIGQMRFFKEIIAPQHKWAFLSWRLQRCILWSVAVQITEKLRNKSKTTIEIMRRIRRSKSETYKNGQKFTPITILAWKTRQLGKMNSTT